MNKLLWLLVGLGVLAGEVRAYDPPRIIGVLTSPQEESNGFASDFCWIGDQNSDGQEDLIVNQNYFRNDSLSNVYLYHGSNSMRDNPAFRFSSYSPGIVVGGGAVTFLGHPQGNQSTPYIGFNSNIPDQEKRVDFYQRSQ